MTAGERLPEPSLDVQARTPALPEGRQFRYLSTVHVKQHQNRVSVMILVLVTISPLQIACAQWANKWLGHRKQSQGVRKVLWKTWKKTLHNMTAIALSDRHSCDCAWLRLFREIADQSQSFITRFTLRKQPGHLPLLDEISVGPAKDYFHRCDSLAERDLC
jgi:hypothetical protein